MKEQLIEKIKILRLKTGISFLDCKKALIESNLDIEEAIDYLRKKSSITANKRYEKPAFEGLIISKINNKKKAIIAEINCETDFVSKSKEFIEFCEKISNYFLEKTEYENIEIEKDEVIINEELEVEKNTIISKFKENIIIKRIKIINANNGEEIFGYVHGPLNYGKIASIVIIKNIENENENLIKDITMQIAAMRPKFLNKKSISKEIIEKEKNLILENIKNNYIDKNEMQIKTMAENMINKFYEENVLIEQKFIKDQKVKIKELINKKLIIINFFRFELGES